jgi:hypothetical protein
VILWHVGRLFRLVPFLGGGRPPFQHNCERDKRGRMDQLRIQWYETSDTEISIVVELTPTHHKMSCLYSKQLYNAVMRS